jgi:hypothetical protein
MTPTSTGSGLILGLRSSSSLASGNACFQTLISNCQIDEGGTAGGWFRVYAANGITPFNGSNRFWHLQKQLEGTEVSAQIDTSGFIIGPVSLCIPPP